MTEKVTGTSTQIYEHLTKNLGVKLKHNIKKIKPPINYELTPLAEQIEKILQTPNKTGKILYIKNTIDNDSGEEILAIERINVQIID